MTATTTQRNVGKIARYALLPGILPRIRELGGSGFGYLAFLIATVYAAVRILPQEHPFTRPANIGKFTIRQAIAAAANNVVVSRKNIDQIFIFVAILAAVVLMFLQFLGVIFLLFSGVAFAQDITAAGGFEGIFKTRAPQTDIAFMMLDHVFGIPDFFGSGVPTGTPFHTALQALFQFYNIAILCVAVLIFLYYVIVVVAETAQTGVPFGKRFSHIYAPFRLVAAIGLLVPLNYGFNASQYITLFAARMGSGMATNGWITFNNSLSGLNPMGVESKTLIADIKAPDLTALAAFMTVVHTCREAYMLKQSKEIKAYFQDSAGNYQEWALGNYNQAIRSASSGGPKGSIKIYFGAFQGGTQSSASELVKYCGVLNIPVNSVPEGISGNTQPSNSNGGSQASLKMIGEAYHDIAYHLWNKKSNELAAPLGERFAHGKLSDNKIEGWCHEKQKLEDAGKCETRYSPESQIKSKIIEFTNITAKVNIEQAIEEARGNADFKIEKEILNRGWGGAGIWYNKIAQVNGTLISSAYDTPGPSEYPIVMAKILADKKAQDGGSNICKQFTPNLSGDNKQTEMETKETYYASAMSAAYGYWYCDNTTEAKGLTGNIIWDAMNIIFGTNGLVDLLKSKSDARGNPEIHPLAQMVAVGKGLVDSAVRNMSYSMVFAIGGGVTGAFNQHLGASLQAMSGFFVSIATIGLSAGFVLFYILPFLPFIYFFFAVGGWVKTIFEAMVGAPLWALAHMRIDGDGFPGRGAMNGYLLIFEIFVRPILTVFGLIGGIATFTVLVTVLNELFKLVVFNTTGTQLSDISGGSNSTAGGELDIYRRAIVDQFFFTIVYAVIVYMMAVSSFKMIDLVPKHALQWLGGGVQTFSDHSGDSVGQLTYYASVGSTILGGQVTGALNQLGGAAGQVAGGALKASLGGGNTPTK
jgi:conjugal transfer/type IV secretion protein DotA/TraY